MQITSGVLTSDQMWEELAHLQSLLTASGYSEVEVLWGWACELPIDELWKRETISVEHLIEHAKQGADSGIFKMGSSDLFVDAPDGSFKYQFCHDSDLHFRTNRESLLTALRGRWIERNFPGYDRVGDKSWAPFA